MRKLLLAAAATVALAGCAKQPSLTMIDDAADIHCTYRDGYAARALCEYEMYKVNIPNAAAHPGHAYVVRYFYRLHEYGKAADNLQISQAAWKLHKQAIFQEEVGPYNQQVREAYGEYNANMSRQLQNMGNAIMWQSLQPQ